MFGGIGQDAFCYAVVGKIGVEIDRGGVDQLQVGCDHETC